MTGINELVDHVGCGDLDNVGACEKCGAIRSALVVDPDPSVHVRRLLISMGQDVDREGLRETPRRYVKALHELLTPEPFEFTTFDGEGTNEMILQSEIPFASLCEHHMLPFVGMATVAYVPAQRIVGLSKLARAVKFCSAGLQNQERITKGVADMLEKNLQPVGVGVVLKARHMCMELRGVKAHGTCTTTSCLRGALLDDEKARAEFLRLAGGKGG
jgi:GTP cyclohydrolase I